MATPPLPSDAREAAGHKGETARSRLTYDAWLLEKKTHKQKKRKKAARLRAANEKLQQSTALVPFNVDESIDIEDGASADGHDAYPLQEFHLLELHIGSNPAYVEGWLACRAQAAFLEHTEQPHDLNAWGRLLDDLAAAKALPKMLAITTTVATVATTATK